MRRVLCLLATLVAAAALAAAPTRAQAPADRAPPAATRTLTLETIAIEGNARTSRDAVLRRFPLREGDAVTPERILDAIDALRASELFAEADFRTAPGSARGLVALTLVVREKGVELRFGTGYRDLDGWYLVPAELRFDNRLGRGERFRITSKLGYRFAGVDVSFGQPAAGARGRTYWGIEAGGHGLSRVYFVDGVEYAHDMGRGHLGAFVGRRIGAAWRVEVGARGETIDADSSAEAYEDDDVRGVSRGDDLPFAELPAGVADDVGERKGSVLHAELARDTRSARLVCATPASGLWGRVRVEGIVREEARATAATADIRAYRAAGDLAFALRLRGGVVGHEAAFYDRFHLGGLYTVRGFPSQSLAQPAGDTRFWTASVEMRGPLVGRPDRPTLAGLLFVDAGDGWSSGAPEISDVASSFGFGLRLRVPWIESFGVDLGVPLSESPVGESFHGNAALGWNF